MYSRIDYLHVPRIEQVGGWTDMARMKSRAGGGFSGADSYGRSSRNRDGGLRLSVEDFRKLEEYRENKVRDSQGVISSLLSQTLEDLHKKYGERVANPDSLRLIVDAIEKDKEASDALVARLDFGYFCEYLDESLKPALHHKLWHHYLIPEQSNKYLHRIAGNKLSILAPRGSSKSTVFGLYLSWAVGIHAEVGKALQILYISANREIALAKCETIRNLLITEKYREVFPFVEPNEKKWSNTLWSIDRRAAGIETVGQDEYTMLCAGILGSIVSRRSHVVAFDDLIKNEDDIANIQVRQKMRRTINSAIRPTLLPGGRFISVGTRYRPDDIHATDFVPDKGWDVLEQSAIITAGEYRKMEEGVSRLYRGKEKTIIEHEEDEVIYLNVDEEGESEKREGVSENNNPSQEGDVLLDESTLVSYWEEMYPLEYLEKVRNEDPYAFSFQYQNKIIMGDSFGIDEKHIKFGIPPERFDYFCIGCDLASSKSMGADFTVFTLVGKRLSDNGMDEFWVLDYWKGKETGNLPKIEHILRIYHDWTDQIDIHSMYSGVEVTPWRIAIEKVAYQASMQDDLTRELYNKHGLYNIVVLPHKMRGGKQDHVRSITGAFANGLVYFNIGIDWTEYVKELTAHGFMPHDDCADSLAIALQSLGVRKPIRTVGDDDIEAMQKALMGGRDGEETDTSYNPYSGYNPYSTYSVSSGWG